MAELEKLCEIATPGPWTAFAGNGKVSTLPDSRNKLATIGGDDLDTENASQVFLLVPELSRQQLDKIERKHDEQSEEANDEAVAEDNQDNHFSCCVPDNIQHIDSKREVNRGYELFIGESIDPSGLHLRPSDARFIAEARTALPELTGEVHRLRVELGDTMDFSRGMLSEAVAEAMDGHFCTTGRLWLANTCSSVWETHLSRQSKVTASGPVRHLKCKSP